MDHAFEREHSPAEALLGAKFDVDGWGIGAAAGPGLLRGYGSPDFRVVGMLGYAEPYRTVPPRVDTDRDGLYDDVDACPREPEDKDGFKDADGCPDPDNDEDGILDVSDRCRNKPEDVDQFEDEDGCPDPDNDKDGILDTDDKCPMEPEDADGFEDADGCPDPDNDKDHVLDVNDACPTEPEDYDGFEDADGCPEEGSGLVKVTCEKIEITDSVYFDTGSDHIQERSFTLLNQVGAVLQSATQIKRLRVEGHTDDRGKDAYNLELSKRRAASVMRYLLEQGVADNRLTSEGYGETRPIADNKTGAGRSQNRRVEFVVLESEGCP
jgi:outer membrane protein OmpA-like peptidoglycan-associated protein